MLTARRVLVHGRHSDLLPPTTLTALESEPHLVLAGTAEERTALALTLSGRMRPDGGTVMWGHDDAIGKLRSHVGLVDSPGISEPERHQRMRDVIAEDLSLLPKPIWRRPAARAWAVEHGHGHILDCWPEQLTASSRLRLLGDLALADDRVAALVFDGPDRLTFDDAVWLDVLTDYAGRGLVVVAVITAVPVGWDGPITVIGSTHDAEAVAHAAEDAPALVPSVAEPAEHVDDATQPMTAAGEHLHQNEHDHRDDEPRTTHESTADPAKDDR